MQPRDPDIKRDAKQAGKSDKDAAPDNDLRAMVLDHAWRMDDLQRSMEQVLERVGMSEQTAAGLVQVVMTLVDQRIKATVASELPKAMSEYERKDKSADRKEIVAVVEPLIKAALDREETVERKGTVQTPDGMHHIDVVETRRRS